MSFSHKICLVIFFLAFVFEITGAQAQNICVGYGPQSPRDIDQKSGKNQVLFSPAPDYKDMNLCNIHFHTNSEHKGSNFSAPPAAGEFGFRCNATTQPELVPLENNHCQDVMIGDTIEVHWVYTTCDSSIVPGQGLNLCLSPADTCKNPQLRVEAQVFTVENNSQADDFSDFVFNGRQNGYFQAKALPPARGGAVTYQGSTTGSTFTNQRCSPLQVTWNVQPTCQPLNIHSLSQWCRSNVFGEPGAHGVRQLVDNLELLSEMRKKDN